MPDYDLDAAHKHCINHRAEILTRDLCGCFYCSAIFPPAKIVEWIDRDQTALCPECPVDAVIGSASGYPINKQFLELMHVRWF